MTTKLTMKDLESRLAEQGAKIAEQGTKITALETLTIDLMLQVQMLGDRIKVLEENPKPKGRDYGPKSQVKLDDLMAWRIKFGDRSSFAVKDNAEFFGLSRGQVYSLDKYTFQHINENSFNEGDIPVEVVAE